MENEILELPLNLLEPVRLSLSREVAGILWPDRNKSSPVLVTTWEGAPFILQLAGGSTFEFFPVTPDMRISGLLLQEVQVRVDVASRTNFVPHDTPLGSLILTDGRANILGMPRGRNFMDPQLLPFWGEYPTGSPETSIAFMRWKLVVRDGQRLINVWSVDALAPRE